MTYTSAINVDFFFLKKHF